MLQVAFADDGEGRGSTILVANRLLRGKVGIPEDIGEREGGVVVGSRGISLHVRPRLAKILGVPELLPPT